MTRLLTKQFQWSGLLVVVLAMNGCCDSGLFCKSPHLPAFPYGRSLAIPETYPLGSVVRSHYQVMQTNGEASDFIIYRHEFVGSTAELTSDGKDHILEIAARMRSTPFPVLIERTENNSDPELDAHRRALIAQILTDFGNPDANQRTIVAPAYSRAFNSRESEVDYYQFLSTRGGLGNLNNAGNFGGFGRSGGFGI